MSHKRQTLIWLSALVFFGIGFSGESPGQAAVEVSIEAESGKQERVPLLPLCVTITVRNAATTTAMTTPLIPDSNWILWNRGGRDGVRPLKAQEAISGALYHFYVTKEGVGGHRVLFADFVKSTIEALDSPPLPSQIRETTIRSGEEWVQDYCLGYGMRIDGTSPVVGLVFPEPGVYSVVLEMPYADGSGARSNEMRFVVKEPEAEADRKAYEMTLALDNPAVFLAPPRVEYGCPFLNGINYPIDRQIEELAARILAECPNSVYAPYARLLLASALTFRSVETDDPAGSDAPDVAARVDGYRLLRQCAEDEDLPRRYREAALVRLKNGAATLISSIQQRASRSAPTLEDVLGTPLLDTGIPPDIVFRVVSDIEAGTAPPGIEDLLRSKLTAEQYEAVREAVTTDASVATSAGVNPIQNELRAHSEWALEELKKLPWRDPDTGELLVTGKSVSHR